MSALNDLVAQIEDKHLKERITREVEKLSKQKKFGMVFEEHLPECTPLYDVPFKVGSKVALKQGEIKNIYKVLSINKDDVECIRRGETEKITKKKDELVSVAEFGEPVYPYVELVDSVSNAPSTKKWHTLIEADNYHALQLLEYLYAGKVDCIYIDPPYNSGARDWKYNNDYVDAGDSYRHSKWLSFMRKRLKIAKKLLNPKESMLIVAIDEKEYLHLGCLLEEMFPEANMQMISSVINRAGTGRRYEFSRTDEYLFFVRLGAASITLDTLEGENIEVNWDTLRRSGPDNTWAKTKTQFYPIFVNNETRRIVSIGKPLIYGEDKLEDVIAPDGCTAVFPIRDNGKEMMWGCVREEFLTRLQNGYIRVGKHTPDKPQKYVISYLTSGIIKDISDGNAYVESLNDDGSVNAYYYGNKKIPPTTNWNKPTHDAQWYGSELLKSIFKSKRFAYPKSLYAVRDCLKYAVGEKKDALIVDFFAGSGTTLHAAALLNAEDGGERRCILVTNNEVSAEEARLLSKKGLHPGDDEWEQLGIAHYVTWRRIVCSIYGKNVDNDPLNDEYITSVITSESVPRDIFHIDLFSEPVTKKQKGALLKLLDKQDGIMLPKLRDNEPFLVDDKCNASIIFDVNKVDEWLLNLKDAKHVSNLFVVCGDKREYNNIKSRITQCLTNVNIKKRLTIPMSRGFAANAVFFKLGFLDKSSVALGQQFKKILPTLWMKAGAYGELPVLPDDNIPNFLIYPENGFAVLVDERYYSSFRQELDSTSEIHTVYIITDSDAGYREMIRGLDGKETYQLYKDYIDNFRINTLTR